METLIGASIGGGVHHADSLGTLLEKGSCSTSNTVALDSCRRIRPCMSWIVSPTPGGQHFALSQKAELRHHPPETPRSSIHLSSLGRVIMCGWDGIARM